MSVDAIIGWSVIAGAVGVLTVLVGWSRRIIEWISRTGYRSARQIVKDKRGGR